MDDGWETARNPQRPPVLRKDPATGLVDMPGVDDWAVLRLCAVAGGISKAPPPLGVHSAAVLVICPASVGPFSGRWFQSRIQGSSTG